MCVSSAVRTVKITIDKAFRVWQGLKPKKRADMLWQFRAMSSGSNGPYLPGSYSRKRIREHYYPDWHDDDFQKLVQKIEEQLAR